VSGGILCNEVLRTALNVLISLPPLSLSNGTKIPEVGVKTLKQVMDFLAQSSSANFTCDEEGTHYLIQFVNNNHQSKTNQGSSHKNAWRNMLESHFIFLGSQLCRELLLCLAIQQGRLAHILMWLHTSFVVTQKSKSGEEKVSEDF
jgi:hypothetical protein